MNVSKNKKPTKLANPKQDGFTILELLVVISILSFIASLLVVGLVNARAQARDAVRYANHQQVVKALQSYYGDFGSWPATTNPLNTSIPGNKWYCLGASSSESCWVTVFHGDDTVTSRLLQYLQGVPTNNASPGTYAYNRMVFSPAQVYNQYGYGEPAGAYLMWATEQPMSAAQCPSKIPIAQYDVYWYCTEFIGPP